jgi:hypothetical protein
LTKNREFLSAQVFTSAALGKLFQRAQKNLASFQSGLLEDQYLSINSSNGELPSLAPRPAIDSITTFYFEAIVNPTGDLPGQLLAILELAQERFEKHVDCDLRCHQPDSSEERFIRYGGVVSFEWRDGEALMNYSPDDVWRFSSEAKTNAQDEYRLVPKLYAEAFKRIVRACEAPVEVVSTRKSYHFVPISGAKCGYNSASWTEGYGGPSDLYWTVTKLSPQEQYDCLDRALSVNACPHPRVWSLHVSTRIWSGLQDFRQFYDMILAEKWSLRECRGKVGLRLGGPEYLDAILPLLKPGKAHRHRTAGYFQLPAQSARGKTRRANLSLISTRQGHRLTVRMKDDLKKFLPLIEKALTIRFQR